jgi:hypothetical protein
MTFCTQPLAAGWQEQNNSSCHTDSCYPRAWQAMGSTCCVPAVWLLRQAANLGSRSTSAMYMCTCAPPAAVWAPSCCCCVLRGSAGTGLLNTHLLSKAFIRAVCQQVGPNITQQVHEQQLALQCCCVVVIAHGGWKVLILAPCGNVHGAARHAGLRQSGSCQSAQTAQLHQLHCPAMQIRGAAR